MNRRELLTLASRLGVVAAFGPLSRTTPLAQAQDAWGKDALTRHSVRPPDYETPVALLDSFITPIERFYVRCHLPVADQPRRRHLGAAVDGELVRHSRCR